MTATGFFEATDYLVTGLIGSALVFMPFWIAIFYNKNFEKLADEEFENTYGAIYEGLDVRNRWSLFNSILFMIRRVILAATCLYFHHYIWA